LRWQRWCGSARCCLDPLLLLLLLLLLLPAVQ
jgi:hypothetical protein